MQRLFALIVSMLLVASCGGATLQTQTTTAQHAQVGDRSLRVVTLTDLDDVRDIAASSDKIFVATDRGVLVYPATGAPTATRVTKAQGLPSDDVRAISVADDGTLIVGTPTGIGKIGASETTALPVMPPIGALQDVQADAGGVIWACGLGGVAKLVDGLWVRFGNATKCTTLTAADGKLYVGTTTGLWIVDGDVVREHGVTSGIPESYVRAIVPLDGGKLMALVAGRSSSQLAFFDGTKWFGYTIAGFTAPVLTLEKRAADLVLVTANASFVITPRETPGAGNVSLSALSSHDAQVRSYRPTTTPADQVQLEESARDESVLRQASQLAEIPSSRSSVDAPEFRVKPAAYESPANVYVGRAVGAKLFLADANRGVGVFDGSASPPRWLRTNDLVAERNLQVASESGNAWLITKDNDIAVFRQGRARRVAHEDGVVPQALSTGPLGLYVLATVTPPPPPPAPPPAPPRRGGRRPPAAAAPPPPPPGVAIRIYKADGIGLALVVERRIVTPTPLLSVPFIGVGQDGKVWAALRVQRPNAQDGMMRGVALIDVAQDQISYLHARATTEADGPLAKQIPDDVSAIEFTTNGDAWLASLTGAVRIDHEGTAVTFGEARGVRGEIVNDLCIGRRGEIWISTVEGVGVYENNTFNFNSLPRVVHEARPLGLAVDMEGNLWGVGAHGVVHYDGHTWQTMNEASGFPTERLVDVEVDTQNRVWLLARDRLLLFMR